MSHKSRGHIALDANAQIQRMNAPQTFEVSCKLSTNTRMQRLQCWQILILNSIVFLKNRKNMLPNDFENDEQLCYRKVVLRVEEK